MSFCIKNISFALCSDLIVWIGTGILILAAIIVLIKKPKK